MFGRPKGIKMENKVIKVARKEEENFKETIMHICESLHEFSSISSTLT